MENVRSDAPNTGRLTWTSFPSSRSVVVIQDGVSWCYLCTYAPWLDEYAEVKLSSTIYRPSNTTAHITPHNRTRYVHVIQYDRQMGSAGPIASETTAYGVKSSEFITISGKAWHDIVAFSLVTVGKFPTNSLFAGSVRKQSWPPLRSTIVSKWARAILMDWSARSNFSRKLTVSAKFWYVRKFEVRSICIRT